MKATADGVAGAHVDDEVQTPDAPFARRGEPRLDTWTIRTVSVFIRDLTSVKDVRSGIFAPAFPFEGFSGN